MEERIELKKQINDKDYRQISELRNLCESFDGTKLKLNLSFKLSLYDDEVFDLNIIEEFMYYRGDELIGYIGLSSFGEDSIEIMGMVHPKYRKRGVFTRLYNLVKSELLLRNVKEVLYLCDRKSETGMNFINKLNAQYSASEYMMVFDQDFTGIIQSDVLTLKEAGLENKELVRSLDRTCFNYEANDDNDILNTFIGYVDGEPVGKMRLEESDGHGGIYGFGVLPELRGKGYGRLMLNNAVNILRKDSMNKIFLEVSVSNERALNLYKSSGFQEEGIMDYFK